MQKPRKKWGLCDFGPNGKCVACGREKQGPPDRKSWAACRMAGYKIQGDVPPPPPPRVGPGTELKKLLSSIGITAKPSCKCNARAREMDARGCDWVIENIETVSGWLEEEAKRRKLLYSHIAGKAIIRLAVSRARKAMSSGGADQT